MRCPHCNSEEVEFVKQYPTLDYAEQGFYYVVYRCKKCNLEFQRLEVADEDIFSE